MEQDFVKDSEGGLAVLMICPQFRPIVGGYERAAERLCTELAAQGIRVLVITERRDPGWAAKESIDGYELRRLPCLYIRRFHVVSSLVAFLIYLFFHGRKFDIWHVHQYGVHAALGVALGNLLGRPVVLKLTSSTSMGIKRVVEQGIWGRILGALHRRVSACLAVSDETREEAINFGIPERQVYLVPNGIDGNQFRPVSPEERMEIRRSLGLYCKSMVLFVGRLSPEKNPLGLLNAWARLNPDVRSDSLLVFVGDGPERSSLEAKIREMELANAVHLAGTRSDVAIWYQGADIYVTCSYREGLSNTMLEALASGLPVISTSVSGSSILEGSLQAGLRVDVGEVGQLSTAVEVLLTNREIREQLGINARKLFESSFSLKHLAPKLISIYTDLLNRKGKRGIG